jgi:hypothetical protein
MKCRPAATIEASERIAEYRGHVFHPDIIRRAVT